MSFSSGSFALRRFAVLASPLELTRERILAGLKKQRVRPLDLDALSEESVGWCHPSSGDAVIEDSSETVFGDTIYFGMRRDVKKVPATLMKLQLRSALEQLKKEAGGSGAKIGKKVRDAVKDQLRAQLLKRTLPAITLTEVLWHADSGEIWLMSGSEKTFELFEKLFLETFEKPLVALKPGTLGIEFDRINAAGGVNAAGISLAPLAQILPADFHQFAKAFAPAVSPRGEADAQAPAPF